MRWVVLGLATLTLVGSSTAQAAPGALGPLLIRDLGLTRAELGLLTSAIWGSMLFTAYPAGILIDRLGERRVLGTGTVAIGLLMLVAATTSAYWLLLVLFLLAGFGSGASGPGGSRAIAAWFPIRLRGRALGVRQGGSALGGLVAAFALPPIAVRFGFRAALVASALVVLSAGVAFAVWYRSPERPSRSPQRRGFTRAVVSDPRFRLVTVFGFVFMGVAGASVSYIAVTASDRGGLDLVAAGAVVGLFQVGGFTGRILWGWLSDHMGRREPVLLLMSAGAVLFILLMSLLRSGSSFWSWAAVALLVGVFGHGWSGNYLAVVAEVVELERAATAIGLSLALSMGGIFVIPPLFGAMVDHFGYAMAWLALGLWSGLGVLAAAALWRRSRPPARKPAPVEA